MYRIQKENDKYVIYKNQYALQLPCKLLKKKTVEFDTEQEACKYIKDVVRLIQKGEEYLERF